MKKFFPGVTIACLALLNGAASGAILTTVPMGGPKMLHVNIGYNAAFSRLEVSVDPTVPQIKPLDVTNPADNFAAPDPWFDYLDPSAQGLAFDREFGFVPAALTDPLPPDTGIWLRNLAAAPQMQFFRYRATDPKAWEPIFGTLGSSNVLQWSLAMFHPSITVPPAEASWSADFEAFAVTLSTGLEVTSITPAPFSLNWTSAASARPVLQLGPDLILQWPASATNYVLESTSALQPGPWTGVTNAISVLEGRCLLPLAGSDPAQYYRLRRL